MSGSARTGKYSDTTKQTHHSAMQKTSEHRDPKETSDSVLAPINYIANLSKYRNEVPYYLLGVQTTPEVPETNIEFISKDVLIKDIRMHTEQINIEDNAFQLFNWPYIGIRAECSYEEVNEYCKDMSTLLAKELEAEKFRNSDPQSIVSKSPDPLRSRVSPAKDFLENPICKAHVDQTETGGLRRLRLHLTDFEYREYVLSGRYRVRIVNERHEWFWASNMVPEEVMVFTTWDSKKAEKATNCIRSHVTT
ncbi:hypothetical protein UA08_01362 [Talaromyces atroroseus]|uniref:Uncharacterized protein n=1 Tax=Talaromyces atroroseus TaxID=1441469 RepID=A0A1Q5Q9V5_TALAT|nr:hypothetical protein UA08_01362 [Talaromyces atroroseus]OKL62714.1 hypothetical protein UA08_01362 [Talaromyces atroroseus]